MITEAEQTERVELLKAKIREQDRQGLFDMHRWTNETPCGTAACIGGTIDMLRGGPDLRTTAGDWIGISWKMADILFYPPDHLDWSACTAEIAIQAVDKAIELSKGDRHDELERFWESVLPMSAPIEVEEEDGN